MYFQRLALVSLVTYQNKARSVRRVSILSIFDHRPLLVSREDCAYTIRSSNAEMMSLDGIRAIADREQRAVYIRCGVSLLKIHACECTLY
jgi:hypothetical protein